MKIIAIDPGTEKSAVLFWTNGHVALPRIMPNLELRDWLCGCDWILDQDVTVACEMVACYGMAVGKEVFETCLFIGRVQEICHANNRPLKLIYRRDVKMHLCGTMKAKDQNVRQALIDKYGVVGTKKSPGPLFGVSSHLWSALAVAVTAQHLIETEL